MLTKHQKKIKITHFHLNKLLLFSFILFLFFQVNIASAECDWHHKGFAPFEKTCSQLGLTDGTCTGTQPTDNICCCKPDTATPALNTSMPNLKIPDIKLQVNIPGLNLTKGSAITCTEVNGQKTCDYPWIGEYVAGIYKYAIGIVGILAAVVLMIGGVMWIVAGGNATMIGEAKSWIGASLTGLVIALCSYLILYQINPALTVFNPLQITQVKKIETASAGGCSYHPYVAGAEGVGGQECVTGYAKSTNPDTDCQGQTKTNTTDTCCCKITTFGGNCQPATSGPCSPTNLAAFGDKATQASAVCKGESANGSLLESTTDKCTDGNSFSIGLFQINLTVHKINVNGYNLDCPSAFQGTNYNCKVINPALYNSCVAAAKDSNTNIQKAYQISNSGSNWGPWSFYTTNCKSYF